MSTVVDIPAPAATTVDLGAFVDAERPQSWSRQMVALLNQGHYREAYEILSERMPFVENQLRPYLERLEGRQNHWTLTHARIRTLLEDSQPQRILDVGCSAGCHAMELARSGHQAWGIDILPGMIAKGREVVDSLGLSDRVHLVEGDIRRLEDHFEPASFDSAVACDIFEHLDDESLMQVLAGLRRVIRPGGRIVIQTSPGRYYYWFEPSRRKLLAFLVPMAWLPDRLFTAYVRAVDRWYIQGLRHEPAAFYRQEYGHINCMDAVHLRRLLCQARLADVRTFATNAHLGFKDEGCLRSAFTRRLFAHKSIAARNVFGVATVPAEEV